VDMPADQPTPVAAVVVEASRLPATPGDAAFTTVRIDPTVLQTSDRLDAALTSDPSFSLYRRTSSLGANPTTQGVSLRGVAGSGASRALVTLDGVPQNDPFGGWVIWTALPPETLGGATIVRGAGAGRYGAGALTGVVDLTQPMRLPAP
jgi:vitamin B12 transporter